MQLYGPSLLVLRTVESELMPQWRRLASVLVCEMRHTELLQAADPVSGAAARRADTIQLARTTLLAFYKDSDKGRVCLFTGCSGAVALYKLIDIICCSRIVVVYATAIFL